MLTIRPDQKKKLHQSIEPRLRKSIVDSYKNRGFDAEDDFEQRTITIKDKSKGQVSIKSHDQDISLISGENRVYRFEYDEKMQMSAITDPKGMRVAFDRDEEQRLTTIRRGDNNIFRFQYDPFSNPTAIQFPDETEQKFIYDENKVVKAVNRNGHERSYQYSDDGALISAIDENGNETQFEYAGSDAPSTVYFPNGDRLGFEYDENGALKKMKANDQPHADFRIDQSTQTMEAVYIDGENLRLTFKDDNLAEAANNHCCTRYNYDPDGRVLSEESADNAITYLRNKIGSLTAMITPDKEHVSYERDSENRATRIDSWSGERFEIEYDSAGALERITYPNGAVTHRHVNQKGLVERLSIETGKSVKNPAYEAVYEYDPCDRMVKARISGSDPKTRTDIFAYDDEGRLLRVESDDAAYAESFHLDAKGNRIKDVLGMAWHNEADQLVKHAGTNYSYDALGNMTAGRCPEGDTEFTYNGRNQLTEAITKNGATRYAYDALGRRIEKRHNGVVTRYTWAGSQLISETSDDGNHRSYTDYLYFPETPVPMAMRVDGAIYYIQTGLRSEPLCMTDKNGIVVWQAEYDAFGCAKVRLQTVNQPFRLAGQYYDEETGLHYNLARYYNPVLGRFLSRDPLFDEGGSVNFYTYCDADPINKLDPKGEFLLCACLIGAAIGATIGAAVETYRQHKAIKAGKQKGYSGWGIVKAAAVGGVIGAIGGGVGVAVEGAFAVGVTATVAGGAGVGALSGAVSSVTEQCAEAALTGKSLDPWDMAKQTVLDSLIGGAIGAVTAGIGGIFARRARKGGSEVIDQVTKKTKPKIKPRSSAKLPKPTSKTDEAVDAVVKAIDDSDIPNKLKKKCQAVGAVENADGSVTIALSGSKETVDKMKSKLEPLLPKNPDGTPKYKFADSEVDTSHFKPTKKVRKDGTQVKIPGSENNCVEPKLLKGKSPKDVNGMTVKWRGKGKNQNPSPRGGNDMAPCSSCAKNTKKMYKD